MFHNQLTKSPSANREFEEITNLIESSAECRNIQKEKPKIDYTFLTNEPRPLPHYPEDFKRRNS